MVLITKRDAFKPKIVTKRKIINALLFGIVSLAIPIVFIVIDPIHMIVNYNLRLHTGSYLYNLLKNELKAAHLSIYLFNITNAEKFLSEEDDKIRVEEVGPFVIQEYLWYKDIHEDGGFMSFTSRYRAEFVPEESIGCPKDVYLNVPNLSMLSATTTLSNYPSFIQRIFSTVAAQLRSRSIVKLNVHDYFWGYKEPLLTLSNKLVPGLIYFKSLGLLARMYDSEIDYKIQVGTSNENRFLIKSVKKDRHLQIGETDIVEESEQTFANNTYECIGYPPNLVPGTQLNMYRVAICKTFAVHYVGKRTMEYGGEALVYNLSKENFKSETNATTNKKYPDGLMDVSACYYGIPFAVSYPHFVDADPKILESIDGIKPNRTNLVNELVIDRKVGFTVGMRMSLQINMVLDDLSFNREVRRLSNLVIPIMRIEVEQPKMSSGIMMIFYLVYSVAPYVLIVIEIIMCVIGLTLLAFVVRSVYINWLLNSKNVNLETKEKRTLCETLSEVPLIQDVKK